MYNFKNKKLIKDIDEFLNVNIKNKFKKLIDIICNRNNKMSIIYKSDFKMKLFGELFIKNNKDNCFLLIDNKINDLYGKYSYIKKNI